MPFPEFEPGKKKLLFFSRGRGRGHAIPDIEIAKQIEKIGPEIEVRFVSYATGAQTLEQFGYPIIDIGQPEDSSIADVTVLAGRLIGWLKPDLVVSHEEFAALPAAKVFDRRTLFITDFFGDPDAYAMDALRFADEILFAGEPGVFTEPYYLADRITYAGPIIREFVYSLEDRLKARQELELPPRAVVLSVLPGSWTEAQCPLFELVIRAFDALEAAPKRLVWIAGSDRDLISILTSSREDTTVKTWEPDIDRVMVASDVVITKATRVTARELAFLGVASIAISHGCNPPDDRVVESLEGADFRKAEELNPALLHAAIVDQLRGRTASGIRPGAVRPSTAASVIAKRCVTAIGRMSAASGSS
jgi:UDP-N-acetylglucosamine:LPS N-acetylglucosamine transferase